MYRPSYDQMRVFDVLLGEFGGLLFGHAAKTISNIGIENHIVDEK